MGSTSLRARGPRGPHGPHGAAALMSSTSLRARGLHGPAVLVGPTSVGAQPPCALAVLMAL
jgi:hypothetical protein